MLKLYLKIKTIMTKKHQSWINYMEEEKKYKAIMQGEIQNRKLKTKLTVD